MSSVPGATASGAAAMGAGIGASVSLVVLLATNAGAGATTCCRRLREPKSCKNEAPEDCDCSVCDVCVNPAVNEHRTFKRSYSSALQ